MKYIHILRVLFSVGRYNGSHFKKQIIQKMPTMDRFISHILFSILFMSNECVLFNSFLFLFDILVFFFIVQKEG